jgi:hypothetical protein
VDGGHFVVVLMEPLRYFLLFGRPLDEIINFPELRIDKVAVVHFLGVLCKD